MTKDSRDAVMTVNFKLKNMKWSEKFKNHKSAEYKELYNGIHRYVSSVLWRRGKTQFLKFLREIYYMY